MSARPTHRALARLAIAAAALTALAAPALALPDLAIYTPLGWSGPVVLRVTPDAAESFATDNVSIPGDGVLYWNAAFRNIGDASAFPAINSFSLDGFEQFLGSSGSVAPSAVAMRLNSAIPVPGGLHTFKHLLNPSGAVTEASTANNAYARQASLTPALLPMGTQVTRSAPPDPLGGTDAVTGTVYPNQDGVRVQSNTAWEVVALRPPAGQDYDLALYDAGSSLLSGFRTPLKTSTFGAGATDFIINNGNFGGSPPHDVGIQYYSGAFQSYGIEHREASGATLNAGSTYPGLALAANQMLAIHQYQHVPNSGAPRMAIELTTAAGPTVRLGLFRGTTTYASRGEAVASAVTDFSGRAVLDVPLETAGGVVYYGIAVYRDQADGGVAPLTYTLRIRPTPADLSNIPHAGNTPPVNAGTGAGNWVTDPTALDGNTTNSTLSFYYTNTGAAAASGFRIDTRVDGQSVLATTPSAIAPGATTFLAVGPLNVRGGRHTLSYVTDLDNVLDETFETNNGYGRQFVWSPKVLADGVTISRPMPPDPLGGLSEVPIGSLFYSNCDGLRTDPTRAASPIPLANLVAVIPATGADVDLDAFALSTGPFNGFDTRLASSERGAGLTDLVVRSDMASPPAMDVGVRRYAGTNQIYVAQNVFSTWVPTFEPTVIGPVAIGSTGIAQAFAFTRGTHPTMTVVLDNLSGDADLGMSVYAFDGAGPHGITQTLPGGYVDAAGAGLNEATVVNTTGVLAQAANAPAGAEGVTGLPTFLVVVWKTGWTEHTKTANFQLRIDPVTTDAPSALPRDVSFAIAGGNPTPGATKLRFDLPRAAEVSLDVLDLQGRRVRSVASGAQSAGSHVVAFDGRDESGARLGNGAYFVRFRSGGVEQVRKLVVLR